MTGREIFLPRHVVDVASYDQQEVVSGYRQHEAGDPIPGPNHSPAYRWGATNRARDRQTEDDGFNDLRRAYRAALRESH